MHPSSEDEVGWRIAPCFRKIIERTLLCMAFIRKYEPISRSICKKDCCQGAYICMVLFEYLSN